MDLWPSFTTSEDYFSTVSFLPKNKNKKKSYLLLLHLMLLILLINEICNVWLWKTTWNRFSCNYNLPLFSSPSHLEQKLTTMVEHCFMEVQSTGQQVMVLLSFSRNLLKTIDFIRVVISWKESGLWSCFLFLVYQIFGKSYKGAVAYLLITILQFCWW